MIGQMGTRARLWTGATLILALALNYVIIGAPMIRRHEALKIESRSILIKYAKAGTNLDNMDHDYLLQVLRKEESSLARQVLILNCVSATIGLLVISWTVFGLIIRRK